MRNLPVDNRFLQGLRCRTLAAMFCGWLAAALMPVACVTIALAIGGAPEFSAENWRILLSMVFVYAGAYALLVGMPIVLYLREKGWLRALPMLAAGALAGAVPIGVMTLPFAQNTTAQVWTEWWQGVLQFGLLGGLSALAFHAVFRAIDRQRMS